MFSSFSVRTRRQSDDEMCRRLIKCNPWKNFLRSITLNINYDYGAWAGMLRVASAIKSRCRDAEAEISPNHHLSTVNAGGKRYGYMKERSPLHRVQVFTHLRMKLFSFSFHFHRENFAACDKLFCFPFARKSFLFDGSKFRRAGVCVS